MHFFIYTQAAEEKERKESEEEKNGEMLVREKEKQEAEDRKQKEEKERRNIQVRFKMHVYGFKYVLSFINCSQRFTATKFYRCAYVFFKNHLCCAKKNFLKCKLTDF